jgi:hypothetical protein
LDFKLSPADRITAGFQYSSFDGRFVVSNLTFNVNRVAIGDFRRHSPTAPTAKEASPRRTRSGTVLIAPTCRPWFGVTTARSGNRKSAWAFPSKSDFDRDSEQGFFRNVTINRTGLTVVVR